MSLTQEQQQINQQQVQLQMQQQAQVEDQLHLQRQAQMEAQPQIRQQSEEQKEALLLRSLQSQTDFGPVHADTVADGEAVQQMAPARKTYKARKEEKRQARQEEKRRIKEAKDNTENAGNIVTYEIKHQMEDYYTRFDNSFYSYFPKDKSGKDSDMSKNLSGVDVRVVGIMCHGFQTDEAGRPATAADEKYQQEDIKIYDAFCSTKYELRRPYLQRMVDEVLSYNLKKDIFSDKSLRSNTIGIKTMVERMMCMENMIKDPNNKFFFRELSPVQWNALGQVMELYPVFGYSLTMVCANKGVEEQRALYVGAKDVMEIHAPLAKEVVLKYQKKLKEYQSMRDILQSALAVEQRVGQMGTVDTSRLPDAEFYQHVRSLVEPEVQKLLNRSEEELHAMSDKDILELYTASLDVDKCLTHRHPQKSRLTMKDELTGKRKREYEHKLTVLRRLAEKAAERNQQGGSHGSKF